MSPTDFAIRALNVVTPGKVAPACVVVHAGGIVAISDFDDFPKGLPLVEVNDQAVLIPGLVDTHVHINEPGRTEWEGFLSATRAAAAGGVTAVVDMPLNSIPPTTTLSGLRAKLVAARDQCHVDTGFWGGVVPGNTAELTPLWEAGVVGFKCFLVHSGVDEFPNVTAEDLRAAMPVLARLGAVLIVHAELPGPIDSACTNAGGVDGPTSYRTFLESRPRAAEDEAVALMTKLSRETGCRVHIVHHSSANSLGLLRDAKAKGLSLTAETCPHYLHFAAEDIPEGATEFKCCPPIRERENREALWRALTEGVIDMVVSDHSPCPPELKRCEAGDFLQAWGGISSLQLRLPVMWTEVRERGHSLLQLTDWLCQKPADLVGWGQRKGAIANGYDADFVIWNPDKEFEVTPDLIHHRHKLTPYNGERLRGVVETTFLRGEKIYDRGEFIGGPHGSLLMRH